MSISSHDYIRIAAKAVCDPRTVQRLYEGGTSRSTTRKRVLKAVRELQLPMPPSTTKQVA